MNLVDTIMKQLSGDVVQKLAGSMGESSDGIQKALGALVPTVLGGLGSVASQPGGGDKIFSAIAGIDDSLIGNFGKLVTGADSQQISQKGTDLLEGLLGKGMLGSLAGVLGTFLGGKTSLVTKLLPMIVPYVLGTLGRQAKAGGLDVGGLVKMLAGQKSNIAAAMPSGLSKALSGVQGLADISSFTKVASEAVSSAARIAERTAASATQAASPFKWIIPVAILGLAAFLGYRFWNRNPAANPIPGADAAKQVLDSDTTLAQDLKGYFDQMGTALNGITDASSAQAALPKLQEMSTKFDNLSGLYNKLPETARSGLNSTIQASEKTLRAKVDEVLAKPGIGDILKPILDQIMSKIAALLKG
jgi:hypothetical protein